LTGAVVACALLLWVSGYTLISQTRLEEQQSRLAELEAENRELIDDLFKSRPLSEPPIADNNLPYNESEDAGAKVVAARAQALTEGKFLMVTFGANWCYDCRTLHRMLKSNDVAKYTLDRFHFVNVNVGKFNQNRDVAETLGVNLERGIPVAVFFDQQGNVIGTTNEGQLEPARHYSSRQILKFIRDIAERSFIAAPDAVR
jgi:protein disulfide-isomerase